MKNTIFILSEKNDGSTYRVIFYIKMKPFNEIERINFSVDNAMWYKFLNRKESKFLSYLSIWLRKGNWRRCLMTK